MKSSDYIIIRANKARLYAPAMLDSMTDHLEAAMAKGLLKGDARIKVTWTVEDAHARAE